MGYSGLWAVWPARGANGIVPSAASHNYFNTMNTRMIYGPIDLSDASQAYMDFYLWLDTESANDYLAFEISGDGAHFQELKRWSGSAPSWQLAYVYYSNYVGDGSVWLAWRFYSNPTINAEGPWLDDMRILKYVEVVTTPTRIPSKTLTPTITRTPSKTPTRTKTRTRTISPTPSKTPTRTQTRTPTKTLTRTLTRTPTLCPLARCTATPTRTKTRTLTPTKTKTRTLTVTKTRTLTPTKTKTRTPTLTKAPTLTPTPTGYRRNDAVAYADAWVHARNTNYISYGTGYNNCDDCTNFMSQVLRAGGHPFSGDTINHRDWAEDWWYDAGNDPTSSFSWRTVSGFLAYTSYYPDQFEVSGPTTDLDVPSFLKPGDFILLDTDDDGEADHGRIFVGTGMTSTDLDDYIGYDDYGIPLPTPTATPISVSSLLIDQHCIDRRHVTWDYKIPDNGRKWYIHVK